MRICLIAGLTMAVCAVFAFLKADVGLSQEKQEDDCSIQVFVNAGEGVGTVAVTVYRDGKAIASQDVLPNQSGTGYTIRKLARGNYEVHFQAPQHTTLIRKVVLDHEKYAYLKPTMSKGSGTIVLGSGPSLHELESRIRQLEETLAKLKK